MNALGWWIPIKYIIDKAHEVGAAVLIDGAQTVPLETNVQELIVILCFLGIKYVDQQE
jgi:cysteine desulfurase/selenocysteine lyase